ncbi:ribosome-binding ATPase YchF [Tanacetum coccineum]
MLWLLLYEVVRCFEDNNIIHVNEQVDPNSDINVINLELAFSYLNQEVHTKERIEKLKKSKASNPQVKDKTEQRIEKFKKSKASNPQVKDKVRILKKWTKSKQKRTKPDTRKKEREKPRQKCAFIKKNPRRARAYEDLEASSPDYKEKASLVEQNIQK